MTIRELVSGRAERNPEAPALAAPGRPPFSYAELLRRMDSAVLELRAAGIGRKDRVALVMPNGPETAAAILSVMSAAACAPLNPQFSESEFDFYLSDIKAGAVLVASGLGSPVLRPARRLNLKVIELSPESQEAAGLLHFKFEAAPKTSDSARLFRLKFEASAGENSEDRPAPEDTALLLHTSGTTSRPKLVPLSQSNLAASALNIAAGLGLGPSDRCLNIMPLFHVHGMVAGLLAPLASGGSVVCSPGCLVPDFFAWLEEFSPSWYTAVPTMHQAILSRAPEHAEIIRNRPLRFIRSCSAALPPSLMAGLEETFGVPVLEAYGMTEASHQMACNPMPPRPRKPGSVGLPAGAEIAVMDDGGNLLPAGKTGEVVVRGPGVMVGYENNPEANAESFTGGWFRTGDLGTRDKDGYLFLTGRKKEIINRGGEKISPREVDEALLEHPAVAQAVTFALPDSKLGEDVAAAVVLKPGAACGVEDLRAFIANKLTYYKVPRLVVLVPEIPKGPTGKLQRIGLAGKLGLNGAPSPSPHKPAALRRPETVLEKKLERIWSEVLENPLGGRDDDFFQSGGDSLSAVRLLERIHAEFGKTIPMSSLFIKPTFDALAAILTGREEAAGPRIVPIRPEGRRPPLYCFPPHNGQIFLYKNLARFLDPDQPVFAFQDSGSATEDKPEERPSGLAADCIDELLEFQAEGPFFLTGFCSGAAAALETARRLEERGHEVGLLALMDGYAPGYPRPRPGVGRTAISFFSVLDRLRRFAAFLSYVRAVRKNRRAALLKDRAAELTRFLPSLFRESTNALAAFSTLAGFGGSPESGHRPSPYDGNALLLRPSREPIGFERESALGWDRLIKGLRVVTIGGYYRTLIYPPRVRRLAVVLEAHLRKAQGS